jgi:hypothetical protein
MFSVNRDREIAFYRNAAILLTLIVAIWAGFKDPVHAQTPNAVHYVPGNPGATVQTAKWTVSNSGSNINVANLDGSTTGVAKAAAVTQSVTVFALPAKAMVLSCVVKTGTAFTGTTTLTATVGITGTLTACVSAPYDMQAAVTNTNLSVALPATPIVSIAGTNLILALTSTIDNITAISAGSVQIWITWTVLP